MRAGPRPLRRRHPSSPSSSRATRGRSSRRRWTRWGAGLPGAHGPGGRRRVGPRPDRPDRRRAPEHLRPTRRCGGGLRRRGERSTRCSQRRDVLPDLPRRRRARSRRGAGSWSRRRTAPTRPSSDPKLVAPTTPTSCWRSGEPSTGSADRTPASNRARSTRSSTTRSATSSTCRAPRCSCAPISSASSKGFDPETFPGSEDLDLCWRARLAGARVMVAPDARGRHHEAADQRREADVPDERDVARRRVRVVLSSYSLGTLLWVVPFGFVLVAAGSRSSISRRGVDGRRSPGSVPGGGRCSISGPIRRARRARSARSCDPRHGAPRAAGRAPRRGSARSSPSTTRTIGCSRSVIAPGTPSRRSWTCSAAPRPTPCWASSRWC